MKRRVEARHQGLTWMAVAATDVGVDAGQLRRVGSWQPMTLCAVFDRFAVWQPPLQGFGVHAGGGP